MLDFNSDFIEIFPTGQLAHWGWMKIDAVLQTTYTNVFSCMRICVFQLKLYWNLFPGTNTIGSDNGLAPKTGDKSLYEQMMT